MTKEPRHKEGHSTEILKTPWSSFLCPECGIHFESKEETEHHLHTVHLEHLRTVHGESHGQDVLERHVI